MTTKATTAAAAVGADSLAGPGEWQPDQQETRELLCVVAAAYLMLPLLVFVAGFYPLYLGLPLAALVLWLMFGLVRGAPLVLPPLRSVVPVVVIAGVWVALTGTIPFFHAALDWHKHWAVFNALRDCA